MEKRTEIIYIESLTNSDKISDFIIRSLDKIDKYITKKNLYTTIINDIENFKYTEITSYKDISYYLNYGFTIILIEGEDNAIALETKGELNRSIQTSQTENTLRGSMDSFVENMQTNLGLIRRRIKIIISG